MATLQDNGYFYCKACRRDDLTRADYYVDNSKNHGLSNLCKRCERERTKKPKHDHYMRSERHQQSLRLRFSYPIAQISIMWYTPIA